ncbi:MAG: hypothetical protein OEM41_04945 [Ignavibacteria bacterium]|nr:hypothetical protein [Ignavibacteria bacterium]
MSNSDIPAAGMQSGAKVLLAVLGFMFGTFALLWVINVFLF